MADEKDYILGTHDEEIERLGLQHRVWRPRTLDAWRSSDCAEHWRAGGHNPRPDYS